MIKILNSLEGYCHVYVRGIVKYVNMSSRGQESETPSPVELDKDRFEEQNVNGETGYFDKVERVFISRRAFEYMVEAISPPLNSSYVIDK